MVLLIGVYRQKLMIVQTISVQFYTFGKMTKEEIPSFRNKTFIANMIEYGTIK